MLLRSAGRGRVVGFDLENRPLAYWYDGETTSEITAFGWKWEDEDEVHTLLLQRDGRFVDDDGKRWSATRAYQHFTDELRGSCLVFGHNIRRHDLPMLNAGLLRLQLPPLRPMLTTDTLKDLPKTVGKARSLAALAEEYDLGGSKLSMSQPAWEEANRLTQAGVTQARARVVSDVLLQERLRVRLLDLGLLKVPRTWAP